MRVMKKRRMATFTKLAAAVAAAVVAKKTVAKKAAVADATNRKRLLNFTSRCATLARGFFIGN
jgi:hypothetical protein